MRSPAPLLALAGLLASAGPLASSAAGQLAETFGPEVAPLGSPVVWSLSNDLPAVTAYDPCGFAVFNAVGQLVYQPPCGGVVLLQPGEVFTHTWPQVNNQGQPVPQGLYRLGAPDGPPVVVGGTKPAIAPLGGHHYGTARHLQLASPLDPGAVFLLLASAPPTTMAGIPTCAGNVPLADDALLHLSLTSPAAFPGWLGTLDVTGLSTVPALAIPNDPSYAALDIQLAFVVLDLAAPCAIRRISLPYTFQVY